MDHESPELGRALERLRLCHPQARWWSSAPIEAGRVEGESEDQRFILVALYEHDITEHFRPLGGFNFLISNGFLASHAYNLALVWLQRVGDRHLRRARLCHNFKKFYAEVLLSARDVLLGRALLLETLAYEQALMEPIFLEASTDPGLEARARSVASAFSSLAQQHELGHYFCERSPAHFHGEVMGALDGSLQSVVEKLPQHLPKQAVEEVLCDGLAAHLGVLGFGDGADGDSDVSTRLRRTVFGFRVFFILMNLRLSARHTAERLPEDAESFELGSAIRPKNVPEILVGRHPEVEFRSGAMTEALGEFAKRRGLDLYGEDGEFPLLPEVWEDLDFAFENFNEVATPETPAHLGCDARGRSLMRLVAESLAGYSAGTEHLLWRSKTFQQGGVAVDP